ncbi:exonuclease domain-containing protein [Flexivirga lutea]
MAGTAVLPRSVAEAFPYSYAVVDVETTGLNADNDRVLQVAVTQLTAEGAVEEEWSTLIDPGCDPGPVHIHGITSTRLRGAPCYADVAQHIHELIDGRVFVAHNARFRLGLPVQRSRARGEALPQSPTALHLADLRDVRPAAAEPQTGHHLSVLGRLAGSPARCRRRRACLGRGHAALAGVCLVLATPAADFATAPEKRLSAAVTTRRLFVEVPRSPYAGRRASPGYDGGLHRPDSRRSRRAHRGGD